MPLEDSVARMWRADSLIALLGKLNVDKLPPHERRAVGECQAKAVDEWLAAYVDLRKRGSIRSRDALSRSLRVN